jgi:hypothetical protein
VPNKYIIIRHYITLVFVRFCTYGLLRAAVPNEEVPMVHCHRCVLGTTEGAALDVREKEAGD